MLQIEDPWDLLARMRDFLIKRQQKDWGKVWSANWSPSLLINTPQGPRCDRFLGYKLAGYPAFETNTLPMLKRFALGTAIHDLYQAWLRKIYKDDVAIEVPAFIPELNFKMKADAVLRVVNGLEIKPVSNGQYNKVVSTGKPLTKHRDQCQFYIRAFGWDTCTILYINIDGLNDWWIDVMAGVPIEIEDSPAEARTLVLPDDTILQPYEDRLRGVLETVMDKWEMPIPYKGTWCRDCRYLRSCKEECP